MLTLGGGSGSVHKIIMHGCVLLAFLKLRPLYAEQRSIATGNRSAYIYRKTTHNTIGKAYIHQI